MKDPVAIQLIRFDMHPMVAIIEQSKVFEITAELIKLNKEIAHLFREHNEETAKFN